jgi:Putative auto-transporter adhesin, head GIN domain
MKSMKLSIIFLFISTILFTSCKKDIIKGSGSIVSQDRSVAGFTKVKITGSADVEIIQGAAFKVVASDYSNLINELETSLTGDELRVGYKSTTAVLNSKAKVMITMPTLNNLYIDGSGDFLVKGVFNQTGSFAAKINGAGDINLTSVSADEYDLRISGSGNIAVGNSICKTAKVNINGSGDIYAFGLQCDNATVDVNGSGDSEITVAQQLTAFIKGSGDIYYKGNAQVNATVSGSGRVIKK